MKFSTVVTYYAASDGTNIVVTRDIENGYYDKTIGNPSNLSIDPSYTPFTCLGLPILESEEASEDMKEGDEVEVDLEKGQIKNLTRNKIYASLPFPEFMQSLVKKGGLLNYLQSKR